MSSRKLLKNPFIGLKKAMLSSPVYTNKLSYDDLINAESALGRTLFGPIPAGHKREFFAAKKNVWIWYESWTDAAGAVQDMIVRYEVRPTGVYKRAGKGSYQRIEGEELNNFRRAAHSYLTLVKTKLYC
ncbi:hypothetical protein IJH01_01380 [Candidatus Saccharibacteria bacterium]|nr:hypothetical protein [Candidatus Saccharibacteria bacterium]